MIASGDDLEMHGFIQPLGDIVGSKFIFPGAAQTSRFRQQYRYGTGS